MEQREEWSGMEWRDGAKTGESLERSGNMPLPCGIGRALHDLCTELACVLESRAEDVNLVPCECIDVS